MTGVRASSGRRAIAALLSAAALGLWLFAGCSDEKSDPTFPQEPQPEVGIWFLGIWGSGPDDIFVVGQPGLIYHWDGTQWRREESGTTAALTDVWGDGTGTVYATGHGGVILRRSGAGVWSAMSSGTSKHLFALGRYQGTVMAAGHEGTLRQLVGQSWVNAPELIYRRDAQQVIEDTLMRSEDIESLTAVGHYGVSGSDGAILMSDPEAPWQLRQVTGGQEWVTCATSNERILGNFVATNGGRLFQLRQDEASVLSWRERYSPALGAIVYGIYADAADTVWAVTNDGRINRIAPNNNFRAVYADQLMLFDIWGTSGTNLYAVGVDGRVLRFHEINPGEHGWRLEDLPLPATKSHAPYVFDKFGRPVH
jgi:hypothetical protein